MNIKTTQPGYGPTIGDMRLSRLSHPRATLVAMLLLAAVFLLFGVFATAAAPDYTPVPNTIDGATVDGTLLLIGDWLFDCLCIKGIS